MATGYCQKDCNVDGKDYKAGYVELDEEELERLCASYPNLFQTAVPPSAAPTQPAPETANETPETEDTTHQAES